jgi:hypothetical protein
MTNHVFPTALNNKRAAGRTVARTSIVCGCPQEHIRPSQYLSGVHPKFAGFCRRESSDQTLCGRRTRAMEKVMWRA